MKSFYSIHNFAKISVDSEKLSLTHDYEHYFRLFKTNAAFQETDYEIHEFSNFERSDKNSVYFPKEKYAAVFNGKSIKEYTTYANRATNLWIQILLLKQGLSFLHGAGAEIDGKGLIFPAFGGVGKTILISELRKDKSFKFFGDDYVIIDKQGQMYSYPSDFSIYDYHLPVFKELQKTSFSRYLRMRKIFWPFYFFKRAVNFLAKRFTSRGAPVFTNWGANYVKIPATVIIPENRIGKEAPLAAGFLLSRYSGEKVKIEEMSLDQMTQEIVKILNFEFSGGLKYLRVLSAADLFSLADFENNQREIIKQCFSKIKRYSVFIPEKIDYKLYCEAIIKFIKENMI